LEETEYERPAQMIGVMRIVCGGILKRYPKLKVAILQAGAGWLHYWAVTLMKKRPSE
jgi:hypothetical protein